MGALAFREALADVLDRCCPGGSERGRGARVAAMIAAGNRRRVYKLSP